MIFSAPFTLSACADEAADTPERQARLLLEHGIHHIDLRRVWGKSVVALTDTEAVRVRNFCMALKVSIHCLYSDACLSVVDTALDDDLMHIGRLLEIAALMGAACIRIFSFVPPHQDKPANHLFPAIRRMKQVTALAEAAGVTLLVENSVETVGEIPSNIHSILHAINSPYLRLMWNPASFVQAGVAQQVQDFWLMLARFTDCVRIQDAVLYNGQFCASGEGDAQLRELLLNLRESGRPGFLALEPAPLSGGGGFGGEERLAFAVFTVKRLLASVGVPV